MNAYASGGRNVGTSTARSSERPRGCRWRFVGAALLVLALAPLAMWAGEAAVPEGEPGPAFDVAELKLSYGGFDDERHALHKGHPGLPSVEMLGAVQVTLGKLPAGYVSARPGVETATFTLSDVAGLELKKFFASAILSIEEQLVAHFNRQNLVGIFVAPHPDDIVVELTIEEGVRKISDQEDRRPATNKALRLLVWTGVATQVRTVASGTRIAKDKRVNNPRHARILRGSPVRPAAEGDAARHDLLKKNELERYTSFLSRHPGRRVDLALSSDDKPGGVVLDYLVSEGKPWYAYMQASNTGSKHTRPWRERFGFVHNQLTNHDDILALDYDTAGFDEAHAASISYEVPVSCISDRLRWRTYAGWNKYTASDLGLNQLEFDGKGWTIGTEAIFNFYQHGVFFADAVAGARLQYLYVKNTLTNEKGEDRLLIPYVGFRFERLTELASLFGSLVLEWNHTRAAGTDVDELEKLGRTDPDSSWTLLRYDLSYSFFIEPLLNPRAWQDPSTYRSSTLAHELFFALRGQYSFGDRLIPQLEHVIGGFYSVRGYPESIIGGDSSYVATAEYRFHVPRIFRPQAKPRKLPVFNEPFRLAPQQVYGRPDWDLILRAFYDVGRVVSNHPQVFEQDITIQGCGVGLELRVKSNFSVRCDYAVALDDVPDPQANTNAVSSGHNRIHTVVTVSF